MSNRRPKGLMISWLVLGVSGQPKGYYLTRVGEQFIKGQKSLIFYSMIKLFKNSIVSHCIIMTITPFH